MKKRLSLFLLLFVFISCISAQNTSSLLWKISGNGLSKPSYIYGTIHIICPQDYNMREEIKTCFSEAEQVFLEIDYDDPQMMQKMMGLMMLTNGKSAKDYLSEEEYMILDNKFKQKVGAGMDQLKAMKPLMLLSMSYLSILSCQPQSFETVFVNMAKAKGIEVKGLETIEFQVGVFDQIPFQQQYSMIADIIRQEDKALSEFNALVDLYKKEDINGLLKLMGESDWNMEEFKDELIDKRNKDWAEKFDGIAKEKSTFFAVGAGHLAGNNGFLKLLKNKGYKVEAVSPQK